MDAADERRDARLLLKGGARLLERAGHAEHEVVDSQPARALLVALQAAGRQHLDALLEDRRLVAKHKVANDVVARQHAG